jgi:PilZ domain
MPFEDEEATGAQLLQRERGDKFAPQAADRIRAAEKCLFSLLPHEELSRLAGEWYEACSQAMLRGNYAPIDIWVRTQSTLAASEGFAPEDLLQLLQICRQSAIEVEYWNEDIFSAVDEVIQDVFGSIRSKLPWNIPDDADYHLHAPVEIEKSAPIVEEVKVETRTGNRRRFTRNRLQLPIRVIDSGGNGDAEEIARTRSISRGGLYFLSSKGYQKDHIMKINFPYWNSPGGINVPYAVKVVRLDSLPDETWGVGVDFLESLGRKTS